MSILATRGSGPDLFCSVIDTRGAIVPYIAVLETLQELGHRGLLCVPEEVHPWLESSTVPFTTYISQHVELSRLHGLYESAGNSRNLLRAARKILDFQVPNVMKTTQDLVSAGKLVPADTVLVSNSVGLLYLGPFWLNLGFSRFVCLEPYLMYDWLGCWRRERSQMMPAALPQAVGRWVFRQLFGGHGRALAKAVLGSHPRYGFADLKRTILAQWHMCSPQLMHDPGVALGYAYPKRTGAVPSDLVGFLDKAKTVGQQIVLLTLGSMDVTDRDAANMVEEFAQGVRQVGNTVGVVLGHSGEQSELMHFQEGFVPYQAVFPKADLIVCHGGAGTTHSVLYAGVPAVVVPLLKDQFDWARRLGQVGMLAGLIPKQHFSAGRLVKVLSRVDATLRSRAERVGEIERNQHAGGLNQVVERLFHVLQKQGLSLNEEPKRRPRGFQKGSSSEVRSL